MKYRIVDADNRAEYSKPKTFEEVKSAVWTKRRVWRRARQMGGNTRYWRYERISHMGSSGHEA